MVDVFRICKKVDQKVLKKRGGGFPPRIKDKGRFLGNFHRGVHQGERVENAHKQKQSNEDKRGSKGTGLLEES